jgi:O-antigen/teichoic acid export membrane protein
MLTALQVAALGAVLPLVVSLAVEKRRDALRWYLDEGLSQAAWLLGLALTLLAAASEAIPRVFGAGYQGSVVPCQVLMAGLGLSAFAGLQAIPAQALDRNRALAIACVVLALLNLALDLCLVPRFGILGASIATSAAFAVEVLLLVAVLNSIGELRSPRAGRRYLALLGLHPVILMAVFAANCARPGLRLLAAAALVVLWIALARLSGVFRMDTLDRMRDVRMPARALAAVRSFFAFFARQETQ